MKFTVFKSPVIMPMMKIRTKKTGKKQRTKSRKKETTNEIKKAERNTERQEETRNLRRGGTKASACFLTRAGARETPPHPYGMAQT